LGASASVRERGVVGAAASGAAGRASAAASEPPLPAGAPRRDGVAGAADGDDGRLADTVDGVFADSVPVDVEGTRRAATAPPPPPSPPRPTPAVADSGGGGTSHAPALDAAAASSSASAGRGGGGGDGGGGGARDGGPANAPMGDGRRPAAPDGGPPSPAARHSTAADAASWAPLDRRPPAAATAPAGRPASVMVVRPHGGDRGRRPGGRDRPP